MLKLLLSLILAAVIGVSSVPSSKVHAGTQDEWQYYTVTLGDKDKVGVYKKNVANGKTFKISSDFVSSNTLFVKGDWIYYTIIAPLQYLGGEGMSPSYAVKIKKNGSGRTQLSTKKLYTMTVIEDEIVYTSYDDSKIYNMKLNGTGLKSISEDHAYLLNGNEKNIYYINSSDGNLYRMNKDGSNRTKISEDKINPLFGGFALREYIVYYGTTKNSDSGTFVINLDGKNKVKISKEEVRLHKIEGNVIFFYEIDEKGNKVLYKINRDGSNKKKV